MAILDLSYDARNGLYAGASGNIEVSDEGVKALGLQLNAGYAKRLRSGLTLDMGVIHSTYSHYSGVNADRSYTEVYAGLGGKWLSSRVSFSPDYFGAGATVHGELDGQVKLTTNLRAQATIGVLVPFRQSYRWNTEPQYDARLGLDETLGRFSLHAAVTSRSDSHAAYGARHSGRNAIIFGVSFIP